MGSGTGVGQAAISKVRRAPLARRLERFATIAANKLLSTRLINSAARQQYSGAELLAERRGGLIKRIGTRTQRLEPPRVS